MSLEVAVITWSKHPDDVSKTIRAELLNLGYKPVYFKFDEKIPKSASVVFTFAPWGRLQQITRQLMKLPPSQRPIWVHWNTEDPPDPRFPRPLVLPIGQLKAWFDRLNDSEKMWAQRLLSLPILRLVNDRMYKFRYVGEYHYAYHRGILKTLATGSKVYADFFTANGIETLYAPWGKLDGSYADLKLERDIDVLWLGTRRTKRRNDLLDQIRTALSDHGVDMVVVDGVEHPPVYGDERTKLFNRAKISLNLLATWYDNTLIYRFPLAAANKSMVISESGLPHCPLHKNYVHYVAVPPHEIVETILYYLQHEQERLEIAEAGYQLVTQKQQLGNSIKIIMDSVHQFLPQANPCPNDQ